jgi:5-formyltetrahydrofolate cyclo-ligase
MGEKGGTAMTRRCDISMRIQEHKKSIRQHILLQREQLSAELRAQYSATITESILALPAYKAARVVLGYLNFGSEFESEILMRQTLADGKQLLLPKVNRTTKELDVYGVTDLKNDVASGLWNIREPLPERCELMNALDQIDFVLLPGVAFGRDGARLGYGGGFYDKLLARIENKSAEGHKLALVAGAYSVQLVESIPQERTDRKVQWLVMENETVACKGIANLK